MVSKPVGDLPFGQLIHTLFVDQEAYRYMDFAAIAIS
jgi:hypothetical protein